jgi:hypothetical protein
MGCGGSSNAGDQLAAQQAQQQAWTNQSVNNINQAFAGFTPDFYNKIGQAYQGYALPQLQQQYQQTQNQLGFRLANQGLGKSSQAQGLYNQLGQQNTQNTQQIANQAMTQEQQLQQQVGQEQSQLIGQAQTANNPSAIGQSAISAASGYAAPSSFQPLGNMFSNFSQLYLGNQLANTYNPATQQLIGYGFNPMSSNSSFNFLPSTANYQ